jgi:SNF family Na+-dependent transporter
MNTIFSFLIQLFATILIVYLIVGYLRPHLRKVLVDLCGTEERAQFWTVFSNILLIGMPVIFAMNYRPAAQNTEELFFDVAGKLSGNLGGLLLALVCIGIIVSFFALVAPRQPKAEAK